MAKINSISVRDLTGAANIGGAGDLATVTLRLDETVSLVSGLLNSTNIFPSLFVGNTPIPSGAINFTDFDQKAKTLSFSFTIPSAISGSEMTLTGLTINNVVLRGSKGSLTSGTTSLTAKYSIDAVAPSFANTNTSFTGSALENTSPSRTALFTATATDTGSGLGSYRLTGNDASLFNIDSRGIVRFKAAPNYESKSVYEFNVIASDRAGNTNSKAATVNVTNADEPVGLAPGVRGTGTIVIAKGDIGPQGKTILADFVKNGTSNNPLSFTTGTVKNVTNFSVANGTLSGTAATAGNYKFTVFSSDGLPNGKDASRSYNLIVTDRPTVTGIKVSDADGNNAGKSGDLVNIKVLLSEPLKDADNLTGLSAKFSAGRSVLSGITFTGVGSEGNQSTLNFAGPLTAGNATSIVLNGLSLNGKNLVGSISGGTLTTNPKTGQSASYVLDNTAPVLSGATTASISENAATGTAIYTATGRDANALRYSLSGSHASLFSINSSTGVVTVANTVDFEALPANNKNISLSVIATDSAGNSAARPLVISVANQNEASQLVAGAASVSNVTLYPGYSISNVSQFSTPLSADVRDPEGANLTYRISAGTLTPGLTLNPSTGAITGKPTGTGAYVFTVTADDQFNNGADASRSYQGSVLDINFMLVDDTLLSVADSAVAFTLHGNFSAGGTVQLFRAGASNTAVGEIYTLASENSEGFVLPSFSKSTLLPALNGSAEFFARYTSPGATPTSIDSIRLNISLDESSPSVSAIHLSATGLSNDFLNSGDLVTASVTYSEAVQVAGLPTLNLLLGANTRSATYLNASGSVVNFVYTIQSGDDDSNGISIAADSLVLTNSNRIYDIAGNTSANLHNLLADQSGFKVDTIAPLGVPLISFADTGSSSTDSITSNDNIAVTISEIKAIWQYQLNNNGVWIDGTGTTLKALAGNNSYQVRQLDLAGNIGQVSAAISVDWRSLAKGFVIDGQSVNERMGYSVSYAGDVNGDGLADLIVSSPDSIPIAGTYAGRSYVVWGKASATLIDLASLNTGAGTQGFVINGAYQYEQSGYSVSAAGDVNGDGLADLIIGAPYSDPYSMSDAGCSYVVWGKTSTAPVDLAAIGAGGSSLGYVLNGECIGDYSGYSVSTAGDVNGDGLADLIIGATNSRTDSGDYAGRTYVVWGKTSVAPVDLAAIATGTSRLGFVMHGQSGNDNSGYSVSSAGDVNGDGLEDLIVGAPYSDPYIPSVANAGRTYVVWGKTSGTAINLANVSASPLFGFVINGQRVDDYSGFSVAAAGDVNGDGLADLIVGAYSYDSGGFSNSGRSYVVWGKASSTAINLSDLVSGTNTLGFVINGESVTDGSGHSVSSAGDVNGDGLADLIIGAPYSDPYSPSVSSAGRTYVVWGKASASAIDLSNVSKGTGGFIINGQGQSDFSGYAVSSAGDVNGDGLADLIVGAKESDSSSGTDSGRIYVIFGKNDSKAVNLSDIASGYGTPVNYANTPTSNADSFNGTTANEIILGAAGNDTLSGGGGTDVLLGGAGNDVLVINANNITALQAATLMTTDPAGFDFYQLARVDGGSGVDTLRVIGGASLDLTQISQISANNPKVLSRISSIEKIDLATDATANTLKLNVYDVLDMAGKNVFNSANGWTGLSATVPRHQLVITGAATDTVDIADMAGTANWTKQLVGADGSAASTVLNGGVTYEIWNHNRSAAQLLIQQGVGVI